jgi:hypothetical protein
MEAEVCGAFSLTLDLEGRTELFSGLFFVAASCLNSPRFVQCCLYAAPHALSSRKGYGNPLIQKPEPHTLKQPRQLRPLRRQLDFKENGPVSETLGY